MNDYSKIVNFLEDNRNLLRQNNFDGLYKAYMKDDTLAFYFGEVIDFFLNELKINILTYFSKLDAYMFIDSESPTLDFSKNSKITEIPESCFRECYELISITLPRTITSIGDLAFAHCTSLDGIIIPDGCRFIGEGAFAGCGSLTSISIPDGVYKIGLQTFYNDDNLKHIHITDSVKFIQSRAFDGCETSLTFHTPPGSEAEKYATKYGFSVVNY